MPQSRASLWLLVGAATGVALAAVGLLRSGTSSGGGLPAEAVARVNGEVIRVEEYERVLAGLAADRREGLDEAQRRRVLDRLIDEELLIQRGLELGLARQDRKVRADLTAAVIASVVSQFEDLQPSDADLERFYTEHQDFFAGPGRLRVRQLFFRTANVADETSAHTRALEATRRLRAGEDFAALQRTLADAEFLPLPDDLLPPAKLRDYLGPTGAQGALALGVGEVSDPLPSGAGYHVLQVIERQPDRAPPFDEIKLQVLAEYRRVASEDGLRAYLDDLRARGEVSVTPKLP